MSCYAHVLLSLDVLSQSKKAEDPDVPLRKLQESAVGSVCKNFTHWLRVGEGWGDSGEQTENENTSPQMSVPLAKTGQGLLRKSADQSGYQAKNPY